VLRRQLGRILTSSP